MVNKKQKIMRNTQKANINQTLTTAISKTVFAALSVSTKMRV